MKKDKQNCEICKLRESEIGYYSPCPKHEDSVPNQEGKIKMYSEENPLFEKEYKGFKVKAWYQRDNENAKVKLWLNGNFFKEFEYQAYAIWNIFLHFEDMVNREIKENLKDSTPEPQKETPPESRGDWEERFVEVGANIEHDRWARWQKYMFSKCQRLNGGVLTIPEELVKRWFRQIETPYSDLSEEEKESDRKETRNYLPLIRELLTLAHTEGIEEGKKETWREILESLELGDVKTIYSQTKETKNNE